MSERLSRTERHGRSHGKKKKSNAVELPPPPRVLDEKEDINLSDSSLVQADFRYKERLVTKEQVAVEREVTAVEMPSRRELYPSQRLKITRWFYNSLLIIFIAIMIALLWWGISESPWGQEIVNENAG